MKWKNKKLLHYLIAAIIALIAGVILLALIITYWQFFWEYGFNR